MCIQWEIYFTPETKSGTFSVSNTIGTLIYVWKKLIVGYEDDYILSYVVLHKKIV